jgi:FAD synthase
MKVQARGSTQRPVKLVIGSWEPLLRGHLALFTALVEAAASDAQEACVALIYPPPVHLLRRFETPLFEYDDLNARQALIASCGVQAMLTVHFDEADLEATAAEFLLLVRHYVTIQELWLGAAQSLGRGSKGSETTVSALAASLGFRLRRLETFRDTVNPSIILDCLAKGKVRHAAHLVGHPPLRSRPASGVTTFNWPPGRYAVVPLTDPESALRPLTAAPFAVELRATSTRSQELRWPSGDIAWLAFVGDCH